MSLISKNHITALPQKSFLLIIVLLLCKFWVVGQNPILKHFNVDNGLPSSHVYCAIQDDKGYIWFGTDKGLSKFDGRNFKNYTVKNGLPNNDCWGFDKDREGRIWINSFNAPSFIENSTVSVLNKAEFKELGKINNIISPTGKHIMESQYGKKWLIHSIDSISELPNIEGGTYIDIDEDNNALCLLAEKSNIYLVKYNSKLKELNRKLVFKIKGSSIADRYKVVNDTYFGAYGNEIVKIKDQFFETYDLREKIGIKSRIILFDYFGDYVFWGTEKSFYVTDLDLNLQSQFDFLKDINPNFILKDNQHNLWICTSDGVYLLSEKNLDNKSFDFFEDGKFSGVKSMLEKENGSLMMILESGHLYEYSYNSGVKYTGKCDQSGPRELAKNERGQIYLIGDLGIYNERIFGEKQAGYTNSIIKNYTNPVLRKPYPIINFDHLSCYPKDVDFLEDGRILIGHAGGACMLTPNGKKYDYNIISDTRSNAIVMDKEGVVYFGGTSGLVKYQNGKQLSMSEFDDLFKYSISELAVDAQNRLWVGIDGFGLYVYDEGKLTTISELSEVNITKIKQFIEGEFWIATNKGVFRIVTKNREKLDYFVQRFTITDGLNSNEINDLELLNDHLFVGTNKGFSIIEDARSISLKNKAPLLIQEILVNDVSQKFKKKYHLVSDSNNIKINYVGLSYNNSDYLNYEYRMIGVDSTWKSTQSISKEFLSLPSGNYEFQLKCTDHHGRSLDQIEPIQFEILLPFYQRSWVRLVLIALFALLGYSLYITNINKIKSNAAKENELNKKFAELEMQALQAQLNPHFIFNSLNAIQDYILSNDEKSANRYIVSFARLMRLFLEASRKKYIKLNQEIELLKLYCDLEKLRFEEKFDFVIQTHTNKGNSNLSIPSHLLQPFVENAINHGLNYKDTPGLLNIDFYIEEQKVICTIVDNGVGIKRAKANTSKLNKDYQSQGMTLVKDRQTIFNFIENMNIKIRIEDNDPLAADVGTKVTVEIPYELKS